MKKKDAAKVKGDIKTAAMRWAESKIDGIFPNQPAMRAMLKKGVGNVVSAYDVEANRWMDMAFMVLGDGDEVNAETMIDTLLDVYGETKTEVMQAWGFTLTVGGGELKVQMPDNMMIRLLMGGNDTVKFTREDFAEIKDFLNN